MLKIAGKKGASEEGGMLIWIVVAIIAAIVVILFFTGGFEVFKNIFNQALKSLEAATQACKLVATPDTRISYCDQWREVEIAGNKQQVNCQYPAIRNQLDIGADIECRSSDNSKVLNYAEKGKEYCAQLFKNGKVTESSKVNDVACASLSCSQDFSGRVVAKGSACDATEKQVIKGFSESSQNICCVKK